MKIFTRYRNFARIFFFVIGFAGIHILVYLNLLPIPFQSICVDACVHACVMFFLAIPLRILVPIVQKFDSNSFHFQLLRIVLCVVAVTLWLACAQIFVYAFIPSEYYHEIVPTIPIRIIIGVLLYYVYTQYFMISKLQRAANEEPDYEEGALQEQCLELIDRVTVKQGHKIRVIPLETIQYIQAEGDYVMIHTHDGAFLKEQTMKFFQLHMSPQQFVRIHRSYIVNIDAISSVQLYEKQNYMVGLKSGLQLKASIAGYKRLKECLRV